MCGREIAFNDVLQCLFTDTEKEPEMKKPFTSDIFAVKRKRLFTEKINKASAACQVITEAD
jgi:hypothetical protein